MTHLELGGIPVDYETVGDGPPVVFLHARPFVGWYGPLLALLDGWRCVRYQRTAPDDRAFGVDDDARLCAELLDRVGVEHPHLVGHSYGGLLALELARQGAVEPRSLALLEPATSGLLPPDEAGAGLAPLLELARNDPAAAMEAFLRMVCGDNGLGELEKCLPGASGEARSHAARFFSVEVPAIVQWTFGPQEAASVDGAVLNLTGGASVPRFARSAEIIESWFPAARAVVIPGASHLLMAQVPDAVAGELVRFWRAV